MNTGNTLEAFPRSAAGAARGVALKFPDAEQEAARKLVRVNTPEQFRAFVRAAHGRVRKSVRWRTRRIKQRDLTGWFIRSMFGFKAVSQAGRLRQTWVNLRRSGYGKYRGNQSLWTSRRTALEWLGKDVREAAKYARFVFTLCRKRARTARERAERRNLVLYLGAGVASLRDVAAALPSGSLDLLRQYFSSPESARLALRRSYSAVPDRQRNALRLRRPARRSRIPRPPDLIPLPPAAPLAPPA